MNKPDGVFATISCPECGTQTETAMPPDACQFFWSCPACGALLKPKPGDCCVFCSFGNRRCASARVS